MQPQGFRTRGLAGSFEGYFTVVRVWVGGWVGECARVRCEGYDLRVGRSSEIIFAGEPCKSDNRKKSGKATFVKRSGKATFEKGQDSSATMARPQILQVGVTIMGETTLHPVAGTEPAGGGPCFQPWGLWLGFWVCALWIGFGVWGLGLGCGAEVVGCGVWGFGFGV